jgi:hypothetical protein
MSPRWTVLTAAVLLVAAVPSWANDEEIEHLIPPGYMPEKASDEQG